MFDIGKIINTMVYVVRNAIYNRLWSSSNYYLLQYNIIFAVEHCLFRVNYTPPPPSRFIDILHHSNMSLFTTFHFSLFFILRDTLHCSNKYNHRVRIKIIRRMISDEILTADMVEVTMIVELIYYTSLNTCVRTGLEYVWLVCGRIDWYWTSAMGFTVIYTETGLLYLNKLYHQQSTPAILQGWSNCVCELSSQYVMIYM